MDSSEKRESLPTPAACLHRPPFLHHRRLELSPLCPQHGGYLLRPNNHHHHQSTAAHGHGHHHHLELSPDCPLHGYLLPHCPLHTSNFHSTNQSESTTPFPFSPNFTPPIRLPQNRQLSNPNVNNLNFIQPEVDTNPKSEALMTQEIYEEEDEEEEEIIFVLTDEWKEFFAKSEAKRRLAKKQAKKKGKD